MNIIDIKDIIRWTEIDEIRWEYRIIHKIRQYTYRNNDNVLDVICDKQIYIYDNGNPIEVSTEQRLQICQSLTAQYHRLNNSIDFIERFTPNK